MTAQRHGQGRRSPVKPGVPPAIPFPVADGVEISSWTGRQERRPWSGPAWSTVVVDGWLGDQSAGLAAGATLPPRASRLSRAPRMGRSGGDPVRLSWLIRATRSIRWTGIPLNNRVTRIHHL